VGVCVCVGGGGSAMREELASTGVAIPRHISYVKRKG
jgi:hypothetical protein